MGCPDRQPPYARYRDIRFGSIACRSVRMETLSHPGVGKRSVCGMSGQATASARLSGHASWVYSVSFSPGWKHYRIREWGKRSVCGMPAPETPSEHYRNIGGVSLASCSVRMANTIASGSRDETIRLWDTRTGNHVRTLSEHTGWVNSVVFSPDGNTIASGSADNTIRLWDARTGNRIRTLSGTSRSIACRSVPMETLSHRGVRTTPSGCGMSEPATASAPYRDMRLGSIA